MVRSICKVRFAESRGAAAVVLYIDPYDAAPLGPSETYPNTVYAPPGATELGSLRLQGDLLTPGYPAVGKTKYCRLTIISLLSYKQILISSHL